MKKKRKAPGRLPVVKIEIIQKVSANGSEVWLQRQLTQIVRRIPKKAIQRIIESCELAESNGRLAPKKRSCKLTCVFVSSTQIRKLNRRFRHKDRPTDVLSFAPVEHNSLGELVFCPQVIRRQAREHSLNYQDELLYMLIHGLLHLLGYEHEKSDKEARVMYRLQDRIFEELRSRGN